MDSKTFDDAKDKLQETREKIEKRARVVGEKLSSEVKREAAKASAVAKEKYAEAVDQVRAGYSRVSRDVGNLSDDVGDYVRDNPARAVLVAAGVGFLIGLLLGRRRGDA
jgi:ElaB/YqjD/DUF883 family membrane-anchored ribosome-binding protein